MDGSIGLEVHASDATVCNKHSSRPSFGAMIHMHSMVDMAEYTNGPIRDCESGDTRKRGVLTHGYR